MDKHIYKMISAILAMCCFFTGNIIITIFCIIFEIGMLVFVVKKAKESPAGMEMLMLDILSIVIVIIIGFAISIYQAAITFDYKNNPNNLGNSKTQQVTREDVGIVAETAIYTYKMDRQLNGDGNYSAKSFRAYLVKELEMDNVKVSGNKVICGLDAYQLTFTVTKQNITYEIER